MTVAWAHRMTGGPDARPARLALSGALELQALRAAGAPSFPPPPAPVPPPPTHTHPPPHTHTFQIRREDLAALPPEADLDAYAAMPVDQFGMALLR